MKYLKKIFEGNSMLDTNTLSDILQDITDLRYLSHVESSWWSDYSPNRIKICIYGKKEWDDKFKCEVAYIYPDDIMEVVERLIDFLESEKYTLEEGDKKEIDVIKNRPIEKTEYQIKVSTGRNSQCTLRWDDKTNGYKVCYSLSLEFRQHY